MTNKKHVQDILENDAALADFQQFIDTTIRKILPADATTDKIVEDLTKPKLLREVGNDILKETK